MKLHATSPFPGTQFLSPDDEQQLPFSLAVRSGNLLFVSGQASVDKNGNIVPGTFEEEFRRSFLNLKNILEAAGSGLDKVIKVNSYLRDFEDGAEYNRLYREIFQEPYPARTTIGGCLPVRLRFEVDCIAVIPEPETK